MCGCTLSNALGDVEALSIGDGDGAIVDDRTEVATLDVLHDDGEVVLLRAHANEQQDARMPQRPVVEAVVAVVVVVDVTELQSRE